MTKYDTVALSCVLKERKCVFIKGCVYSFYLFKTHIFHSLFKSFYFSSVEYMYLLWMLAVSMCT